MFTLMVINIVYHITIEECAYSTNTNFFKYYFNYSLKFKIYDYYLNKLIKF